jgi:hypothetical protein
MIEGSALFYEVRQLQVGRGALASKARWAADEQSIRLDLVLGAVSDLSLYQDWLASARVAGASMTAAEKARSRELAGNP